MRSRIREGVPVVAHARDAVDAPMGPGCWRSPRGKSLSMRDRIPIRIVEEDLEALHRAVDVAMSYLDEARGSEERVPFVERLIRLYEMKPCDGKIVVARHDLHALHQALHAAAGHAGDDAVHGAPGRSAFVRSLARVRKSALEAALDHDDVPERERGIR